MTAYLPSLFNVNGCSHLQPATHGLASRWSPPRPRTPTPGRTPAGDPMPPPDPIGSCDPLGSLSSTHGHLGVGGTELPSSQLHVLVTLYIGVVGVSSSLSLSRAYIDIGWIGVPCGPGDLRSLLPDSRSLSGGPIADFRGSSGPTEKTVGTAKVRGLSCPHSYYTRHGIIKC